MQSDGHGARRLRDRRGHLGVVVLGMGRSGTSVVAALFRAAGLFAGDADDLVPPADSNPRGHHENLTLMRADDAVLEELGAAWYISPPAAALHERAPALVAHLRSLLDRLIERAAGAPVVVKDPRIGVLLELWAPIMSAVLHPVLVVRDPAEIALSLLRRDGTPPAVGVAMWELHMTALLGYLNGRVTTVVPYAALSEDSELGPRLVEAALAHVTPALAARTDPSLAGSAVDPGLRHNRAHASDRGEVLTARQGELCAFLGGLAAGDQRLEVPQALAGCSEHAHATVLAWHRVRLAEAALAADLEAERGHARDGERALAARTSEAAARAEEVARLHDENRALADRLSQAAPPPPARGWTRRRRSRRSTAWS